MTENSILSSVDSAGQMFSRAVLDTSRTRVRTFGSDDAGHLVGGRVFRQVTLDDPGLPPVVGVITSKLSKEQGVKEQGTKGHGLGLGIQEFRS